MFQPLAQVVIQKATMVYMYDGLNPYRVLMMMMGWDYMSGLWPPMGLLFIPQMTEEHGEPWWNDVNKGKFLIRSPAI
jgi:hypothetical protein